MNRLFLFNNKEPDFGFSESESLCKDKNLSISHFASIFSSRNRKFRKFGKFKIHVRCRFGNFYSDSANIPGYFSLKFSLNKLNVSIVVMKDL